MEKVSQYDVPLCIISHSFSRLVNSSILWVEFTQWKQCNEGPCYYYVQEANLAYSSKKEQAELLQKVRHTLSSDCWLGHSSIALCAGVGCLRCWRWWGRSSSNGIQTTGTHTLHHLIFPSCLLYPPPFPSLPFLRLSLFLSFTSGLSSFLLGHFPTFVTY